MEQQARWQQFKPQTILSPYRPHPHQVAFHKSVAKYRALVSGVGAGKTRMGCEEILKWSQIYPGGLHIIGRLTAKSLRETTQRRFFEVCPSSLVANYNKSEEHMWLKTNKKDTKGNMLYTEVMFMHLDDPGPLGSLDISSFWIDEAHEPDGTEVPEKTFQMLTARLRHPVGPHRGFVTSNSGGKDWVWKWFFKPGHPLQYAGWTASTEANALYLPPGYAEELRANNPEVWVSRFLDASFDAFEGQIWTDFDEKVHTYNPVDVELSKEWDYGVGFDFGVSAPTAAIYGCVDRDDNVWIFDEDYKADANIPDFATLIKQHGYRSVYADPSVTNRGPDKKSPKQLYEEYNVTLIPSSNDEDYFIPLFKKLLVARNKDGTGKIRISTRCVNLINEIKQEAWDPLTLVGTTHDRIKKGTPNHARDAFKYFLNMFGLHPGLLSPINPKKHSNDEHKIKGEWEHDSYWEDTDFDKDDYPFPELRQEVL